MKSSSYPPLLLILSLYKHRLPFPTIQDLPFPKFLKSSWWRTPIFLATQEGEVRKSAVQGQPGQSLQDLISEIPNTKKGLAK
jgi:hypothetical protein